MGAMFYDESQYWYLNWNLFLAWLPLLLAWWLSKYLKKHSWQNWQALLLTLLWLGFLPNSFYILSDIMHMQTDFITNPLYTTVMMVSFSLNGLILGFMSLYIIHKQLLKRIKKVNAHIIIASILLLCSFAIYLGRYLRWNTWDVLINPAGLLFDVSDRITNPVAHPQTLTTTVIFFALLDSVYAVIWQAISTIRSQTHE
jgi:uncharacterized membrane protein